MKCSKCGYLGFETTDRCRNCGYDFSLLSAEPPDLALQTPDASIENGQRVDLPDLAASVVESGPPAALDLDRLFGVEEAASAAPSVEAVETEPSALPFDQGALPVPPPPARPPLSVRRTTDPPRPRPRTTRPPRVEPTLDLGLDAESAPSAADPEIAGLSQAAPALPPTLGQRLLADLIDGGLLAGIHVVVLALTLRLAGLEWSGADLAVIPPVPFAGFALLMSVGYAAMFTVAGGQTIGKMIAHLRVLGDDGRSVDLAGGVLRAIGCALVPVTLGLTYAPVFFTPDRRALHDRLAGTRVVRA